MDHKLYESDVNWASKLGKQVTPGDLLMTASGKTSQVVQTEVHRMAGAFVPLTNHGTLLVDGILGRATFYLCEITREN